MAYLATSGTWGVIASGSYEVDEIQNSFDDHFKVDGMPVQYEQQIEPGIYSRPSCSVVNPGDLCPTGWITLTQITEGASTPCDLVVGFLSLLVTDLQGDPLANAAVSAQTGAGGATPLASLGSGGAFYVGPTMPAQPFTGAVPMAVSISAAGFQSQSVPLTWVSSYCHGARLFGQMSIALAVAQ